MTSEASELEAALERVSRRRPPLIDLGLKRMATTLERLGAPHRRLPPVFHVAGTNGKGSTVAYIASILRAAGKRVHVYTSPHLVRYNERIVIDGAMISDADFIDAVSRADAAAGDDELTFFEAITCAAFIAFSEKPADYLVLEVGLGGRLDATNVIDRPAVAVVTPIGLDHQAFLGDDIAGIAREKAGIFRPDAPAVIGEQEPAAMAALETCATSAGARLFAAGRDWTSWAENGRLIYQDTDGLCDLSPPRLPGAHQYRNAALAVAAVKAAGLALTDATLSAGVASTTWPARLQRMKHGPLVERLTGVDAGSEVWLDGGHNPHAGVAIAAAMATMEETAPRPLVMICGMQANKDMAGYFEPFAGLARHVFAVQATHSGSAPAPQVAAAARKAGLSATSATGLVAAAAAARGSVTGPARFLISGSLYLAGEVLKENG